MESMNNMFINVLASHQNDTTYYQIQNQLLIHDHNSTECLVFSVKQNFWQICLPCENPSFWSDTERFENPWRPGNDQGWFCRPSFYSVRRGGGKKAGGERNRDGKTGAGRRAGLGTFHWRKSRKKSEHSLWKTHAGKHYFWCHKFADQNKYFWKSKMLRTFHYALDRVLRLLCSCISIKEMLYLIGGARPYPA